MMCVYEALDEVIETIGVDGMADYIFVNYPMFADDLRHQLEARIYFEAMMQNKYQAKEVTNEGNIKVCT